MSPPSPQFLNQAPPRAQQLRLPDFLRVPHLGHTEKASADFNVTSGGPLVPDRADLWEHVHDIAKKPPRSMHRKHQAIPTCNLCQLKTRRHAHWRSSARWANCQRDSDGQSLRHHTPVHNQVDRRRRDKVWWKTNASSAHRNTTQKFNQASRQNVLHIVKTHGTVQHAPPHDDKALANLFLAIVDPTPS